MEGLVSSVSSVEPMWALEPTLNQFISRTNGVPCYLNWIALPNTMFIFSKRQNISRRVTRVAHFGSSTGLVYEFCNLILIIKVCSMCIPDLDWPLFLSRNFSSHDSRSRQKILSYPDISRAFYRQYQLGIKCIDSSESRYDRLYSDHTICTIVYWTL